MRDGRELDLILFGATGFVGRLTAGYLAEHAPPACGSAWYRSEKRLAAVRDSLGATARTLAMLAADALRIRWSQGRWRGWQA